MQLEVPVIRQLKLYDWTFSSTAETVVGALLAITIAIVIVVSVFA